jgi:ribosome-associated translation inhibitor RaiA
MIISIKYRGMHPPVGLDQSVADCLIALSKAASIKEASVLVEHLPEAPLTFRTELSVLVPGADFQIRACDASAESSFNRAAAMLEKRLRTRAMQRARQVFEACARPPRRAVNQTIKKSSPASGISELCQ